MAYFATRLLHPGGPPSRSDGEIDKALTMSRSTDTRNFTEDYPSFLDSDQEPGRDENFQEFESDDDTNNYVDAESGDVCEDDYDENDYEEHHLDDEAASYDPLTRPTSRSSRRRYQAATKWSTGAVLMATGLLAAATGAATAFLPEAAAVIAKIIEPQILAILGLSLVAIASGMRRTSLLQQRLDLMDSRRSDLDDELRDTLAHLADGATPATGEAPDLHHLMLSLQRQDQKINNLTKAIKMYGKPLMEIAGQGTELAGSMGQVKALIEGAAESTRQAVNRVEQQVRSSNNTAEIGAIPGQLNKLEAALDNITKQFDTSTQGLTKGIEQMRSGSLSDLESSVREVQRELSGLTTGMSQVEAAVKISANSANSAATAAARPAPSNTSMSTQPAEPSKAPTSQASDNTADEPVDDYATGQRKVASKNVLGAIAKLKQMKG